MRIFDQSTGLVACVLFSALVASPGGAAESDGSSIDGGSVPTITREQIEADWLLQDVVRKLPPAEPYRATPMTTEQDAAGAVDGVKDGRFSFHTERDASPWWQVDLGEPVGLERIVVYNRCDGNVEGRAARLKVLLSVDGNAWTDLYEHDGTPFFGQADGKPLSVPAGG
ncbi:MAG: discoidin domain-containing protein, partial [Planctomycetota bacterium]